MRENKSRKRDGLVTAIISIVCFIISYLLQKILQSDTLIPAVLILGVFIISIITTGYRYGIVASVICVLEENFAFMFPYYTLNFSIIENVISAGIMIVIALLTCSLTIRLKHSETLKAEGEKERMRANLMRAISHDLRTPLTTIYGASSMLLDSKDELTEEQKELMISEIKEDSRWLSNMVENILSITKIDEGRIKIIKTPTVVEELIDSVLVKFKNRYKDIKVQLQIPAELLIVDMDAILIEQVLLNLLENAAEHAVGMNELTIKVVKHKNQVIFSVIDDGCGIEEDKLRDIFIGYNITDASVTDKKRKNSGIGLSVCATIIKAHGGTIKAENNKKGGSTFSFILDRGEEFDVE